MKDALKRGADVAGRLVEKRPKETRWTLVGAAAGAVSGFALGSIGVVAHGGGTGFSVLVVAAVLAGVGALAGSRFGVWADQRTKAKTQP